MRPLILASTSPYRRALLERLGVPFETENPRVREDHLAGEAPADRARRLAVAKAAAVADRRPEAIVIGSDQVAAAGERILDKPGSEAACRAQLGALSGTVAHFWTGVAVLGREIALEELHLDSTAVVFRTLGREEVARYVRTERPFDCAGGFKSEGLGIALFERLETGDPTALVGLPLIWLAQALRQAGYAVP